MYFAESLNRNVNDTIEELLESKPEVAQSYSVFYLTFGRGKKRERSLSSSFKITTDTRKLHKN
jgi:hypothetical protein